MNTVAARQRARRGVVKHGTHWRTATTTDFYNGRYDPERLCVGLELSRTRTPGLGFVPVPGESGSDICWKAKNEAFPLSDLRILSLPYFIRLRALPYECAGAAGPL